MGEEGETTQRGAAEHHYSGSACRPVTPNAGSQGDACQSPHQNSAALANQRGILSDSEHSRTLSLNLPKMAAEEQSQLCQSA